MISSEQQIKNLFAELDSFLASPAKIYLIGGAALMLSRLKSFTKDLDIIVKTQEEYRVFEQAVRKAGFKETALTFGIEKLTVQLAVERADIRLDLFLDKVCGKMGLSHSMISRARPVFSGKNLAVLSCANEDIFVFKTITVREGDKDDCKELIKYGLDWKIIIQEIRLQVKEGNPLWISWINERLQELADEGFNIPILEETTKESMKYLEDYHNQQIKKKH